MDSSSIKKQNLSNFKQQNSKNNSLNTINYTMPKDTYYIINRVI